MVATEDQSGATIAVEQLDTPEGPIARQRLREPAAEPRLQRHLVERCLACPFAYRLADVTAHVEIWVGGPDVAGRAAPILLEQLREPTKRGMPDDPLLDELGHAVELEARCLEDEHCVDDHGLRRRITEPDAILGSHRRRRFRAPTPPNELKPEPHRQPRKSGGQADEVEG